jgi:hypothetical protein
LNALVRFCLDVRVMYGTGAELQPGGRGGGEEASAGLGFADVEEQQRDPFDDVRQSPAVVDLDEGVERAAERDRGVAMAAFARVNVGKER